MLRAIKIIFVFLFLLGVALMIYAFLALTEPKPKPKLAYNYPKTDMHIDVPQEKKWYSNIKATHQSFAYPATELEFSVNFLQKDYKKDKTQVVISNVDEELLFCLREVLEEEKVHFAYKKSQNILDIILYVRDSQKEQLLKVFDYYGIRYKIN